MVQAIKLCNHPVEGSLGVGQTQHRRRQRMVTCLSGDCRRMVDKASLPPSQSSCMHLQH